MILDCTIDERDIEQIKSFDKENLLDYVDDKFTFHQGTVKDENGIIAYGMIRIVSEYKIVVNPKYSPPKIAKAINELYKEAIRWSKEQGPNEIIVVITQGGEYYEKFLEHQFNFEKINGTPMKLEV